MKEKIKQYLQSDVAKDLQLVAAFTVNKTPTPKDDEVVANAAEYSDLINEFISGIDQLDPTEREAKKAAIRILKEVTELTATKWDDRLVAALDLIV